MTKRLYLTAALLLTLGAVPCASAAAQWWNPFSLFRRKKAPEPAPADVTGLKIIKDTTPPPIEPKLDVGRGMDAELRVAIFDLLSNHTVAALARLERLATATAEANAPRRADALFYLAEAQYRLGLDSAFRATAQAALSAGASPRYTALLRAQSLLGAYRAGDFARVDTLSRALGAQDETRGLASLVSGLAAYEGKRYADAQTLFAAARRAGGPYARYAEYMDVLTTLRGDTTQAAMALARFDSLARGGAGEFADQVRLTAAQLAYQTHAYDRAIAFADAVRDTSGLAPQALLTKAWAQYKAKQIPEAGQSFARFAEAYSQLPQRDEARLMAAQALLQQGKTAEAGTLFRTVTDTAGIEAKELEGHSADRMADAAKALVQSRVAGLLFVTDPSTGKTISLQDVAGADAAVLTTVMNGGTASVPLVGTTELISLADLTRRFSDAGTPLNGEFPHRILFAPMSASGTGANYGRRASALFDADLQVALAHYALQTARRDDAMRASMVRTLQSLMSAQRDSIGRYAARVDSMQGKITTISAPLDAASGRIHESLSRRLNSGALRLQVQEVKDRLRGSYGADFDAQVAAILDRKLDSAIAGYPLFQLRDSVRVRNDRIRAYLAETQATLATLDQTMAAQLTQTGGESPAVARLRAAEAAAEARRGTAETALVAAVSGELDARAGELLATLQHDLQAAELGTASTSFFKTIDQDSTRATPATTGTSRSGTSGSGTSGAGGGSTGTTTGTSSGSTGKVRAGTTGKGAPAATAGIPSSKQRK